MGGKDLLQNGNYWVFVRGSDVVVSYQMRQPGQWHCFDINIKVNRVFQPITKTTARSHSKVPTMNGGLLDRRDGALVNAKLFCRGTCGRGEGCSYWSSNVKYLKRHFSRSDRDSAEMSDVMTTLALTTVKRQVLGAKENLLGPVPIPNSPHNLAENKGTMFYKVCLICFSPKQDGKEHKCVRICIFCGANNKKVAWHISHYHPFNCRFCRITFKSAKEATEHQQNCST